jgi:tetratricopeptide (TPR) repeat protein
MANSPPLFTPPPVDAIERRLRWRVLPTLLFGVMMCLLLTVAIVSLTITPKRPHGLPDDADAGRVLAVLAGRVSAEQNDLRWRSAVLGGEPERRAAGAMMLALTAAARPALEGVRRRHRSDPRALAALAALDMVAHDYPRAAARYRRACELAPHYGEGRLGAGVALALEADRTADVWPARALRLQAAAQFSMVDSVDVEYPLALYDRALVLAEVGRADEAAFWAGRYLALDGTSEHAATLREAMGQR